MGDEDQGDMLMVEGEVVDMVRCRMVVGKGGKEMNGDSGKWRVVKGDEGEVVREGE